MGSERDGARWTPQELREWAERDERLARELWESLIAKSGTFNHLNTKTIADAVDLFTRERDRELKRASARRAHADAMEACIRFEADYADFNDEADAAERACYSRILRILSGDSR